MSVVKFSPEKCEDEEIEVKEQSGDEPKGKTKLAEKQNDNIKRICDPCRFESKESKAQGYCKSCKEFLCTNCEKFHKKFQATRLHKIVHGVLMPKPVKKAMLQCEYHPNNQVEWFCKDHADVICKDCKEQRHGICDHVLTLEMFVGNDTDIKEIDELIVELKGMKEEFQNITKLRQNDIFDLDDQKTKCQTSITTIRNDFNTILDRLEQKMSSELDENHENEFKVLTDQIKVCERALTSLNTTVDTTEKVKGTEDSLAAFCMLTKTKKKLNEYGTALQEIKQGAYTVNLGIVPRPGVADIMNEFVSFGEVNVDIKPTTFSNKLHNLLRENMRVVESKVHSVRMVSDDKGQDCEITGSTFLDDGSLVICDKHNHKLKLLDATFACTKEHTLNGAPWDVAIVKDKWIVVTLPFTQSLQFVQVDLEDGFRSGRSIKTDRMCWGVAMAGEEIVISCHDNPGDGKIHILDKRGHTKRILGAEAEGTNYVFDLPLYIALNKDCTKIFIADGDLKRTVTCIEKKNGQIVYDFCAHTFGYSKLSLSNVQQNPWSFKILVDEADYVFAYIGDKEMVQVVTDEGEKCRTLLTNKEDLYGPHALSYRSSDSTLVIGLWDQIQTFRFKEITIKT